jgi:hypothetical protein
MKKILLVSATLFIILGIRCSKSDYIEKDLLIDDAYGWFSVYAKSVAVINDEFQDVGFKWEKAKIVSLKNGYRYVTVPLKNNHVTVNFISSRTLMIFPAKNGGFFHRILVASPEMGYFLSKKMNPEQSDFNGVLSYWDYSKGFTRGVYVRNGEYVSRVKLYSYQQMRNAVHETANTNTSDLPMATVTAYKRNTNTNYQITGEATDIHEWMGMGPGGNPSEYCPSCNNQNFPSDVFESGEYDVNISLLTDPCLMEVFNKMVTAAVNPFTNIYTYFNNNNAYQLYISNAEIYETMLPSLHLDEAPASTVRPPASPIGNQFIYLNLSILENWSQEAVSIVICHEFFHAYINDNPGIYPYDHNASGASQHELMLFNLMESMKGNLQTTFPGLTDIEAYSLCLSGLGDPELSSLRDEWFLGLKNKYPTQFGIFLNSDELVAVTDGHRTGNGGGTRCDD